jgi:KaiC/GvpD/RAD55 family RecA-like ATPase
VPDAPSKQRPRDARVSFGVPELDEMLDGGLMAHRPYLIVGPAGTGKTSVALQFLCEGARRGERCLYVTLEDPPNEVRWNHRALRPDLDSVDVFDAIPDVMRYERVPFKDIAAVRQVVRFRDIPERIRVSPEFSSVEVTGTALEQMLRSEVQKRGYARLVIDSLTALQYFCMKGFDPIVGAQTFLRFLTDLRTTTLLTVEAPLEDVETPERMLARGEVHLFRWELEGMTVRAVGVEKFRGSAHDVRLHPYRIGPKGIDVQLSQTISRDTRRIVGPALDVALRGERPIPAATSPAHLTVAGSPEPLSQQIRDLVSVGVDIGPLRTEVEAAIAAYYDGRTSEVAARIARISALAVSLGTLEGAPPGASAGGDGPGSAALRRLTARAERSREGEPPTELPPWNLLGRELMAVLTTIPPASPVARPVPPPPPGPAPTIHTSVTPPLIPSAPPPLPPTPVPPLSSSPNLPSPSERGLVPEPAGPERGSAPPTSQEPASPPPLPARPSPPGPVAEWSPPATALRSPPSARRVAVLPVAEPPPWPKAVRLDEVAVPPAPSVMPPAAPAPGRPPESEAPPAPRPTAPRRRRKTTAAKVAPEVAPAPETRPSAPPESSAPGPATTTAPAPTPAPAPAKSRRRAVRRKKAPPVVAASPGGPPPEATPPKPTPAAPPAAEAAPAPTEGP